MRGKEGFTLLEVMVALVIFVVIGMSVSGLMATLQQTKASLDAKSRQLEGLQNLLLHASHDMIQITPRTLLALTPYDDSPAFTRIGWRNPLDEPRSEVTRVRYVFANAALKREAWRANNLNGDPAWSRTVATGMDSLRFQSVPNPDSRIPSAIVMFATFPEMGAVWQIIPLVHAP